MLLGYDGTSYFRNTYICIYPWKIRISRCHTLAVKKRRRKRGKTKNIFNWVRKKKKSNKTKKKTYKSASTKRKQLFKTIKLPAYFETPILNQFFDNKNWSILLYVKSCTPAHKTKDNSCTSKHFAEGRYSTPPPALKRNSSKFTQSCEGKPRWRQNPAKTVTSSFFAAGIKQSRVFLRKKTPRSVSGGVW